MKLSNMQEYVRPLRNGSLFWEAISVMSFRVRLGLVIIIVLVMFILHNSFWLWDLDSRLPLLFGFMPFAYSYYVGYTILAVLAMRLIIGLAWPDPPEDLFEQPEQNKPAETR